MYCIKCGVKLADTEKSCPLCGTVVYHPDIKQENVQPLYPKDRYPRHSTNAKAVNGIFIILFLIPLLICFQSDIQGNGIIDWFGYAAFGICLAYLLFAFPLWFKKPNPVIFVPCDFAAILGFLLYIDLTTTGTPWFMSFAFPVVGGIAIITCTVVTLLRYLKKGRLFIFGGASIALGGMMLLIEFLLHLTFSVKFSGWSVYPLIVLVLLGGILIYLAINKSAREMMERKLFF
ncbi:MAG: hypothetical protein E7628_03120 [Ruminococcaceae bacterium]|nr:hypothetical protein [Oscillospiraceae bacterium]